MIGRILTDKDIDEINEQVDSIWLDNGEGIMSEGAGVPDNIKEVCIYRSYNTGGVSGGSCWEHSNPRPYRVDELPEWKTLRKALDIAMPGYTEDEFKMVQAIALSNETTDYQYYGNYDDYCIEFIPLSKFYQTISKLRQNEARE
jgi:hypothetical protein